MKAEEALAEIEVPEAGLRVDPGDVAGVVVELKDLQVYRENANFASGFMLDYEYDQ